MHIFPWPFLCIPYVVFYQYGPGRLDRSPADRGRPEPIPGPWFAIPGPWPSVSKFNRRRAARARLPASDRPDPGDTWHTVPLPRWFELVRLPYDPGHRAGAISLAKKKAPIRAPLRSNIRMFLESNAETSQPGWDYFRLVALVAALATIRFRVRIKTRYPAYCFVGRASIFLYRFFTDHAYIIWICH